MTTKHGSHLSSTLPAVLKEYLPEYEPKQSVYLQSGTRAVNLSRSTSVDVTRTEEQEEDDNTVTRAKSEKITTKPLRSSSPSQKSAKRRNNQKLTELSQKWESTSQEVVEDHYEKLRQKVTAQRELIRKQDEIAKHKRLQFLQEEQQQKEAEKVKKQEVEKALVQIGKQSLEEDKKVAILEKKTRFKETKAQEAASVETSPKVPAPKTSEKMPIKKGGFKASLPPMSRTPSNLDMSSDSRKQASPIKEDLEWHQEQLYKVFGNQADDFLNPKMEQQPKKSNRTNNSKLQKQGDSVEKLDQILETISFDPLGRAGAQRLWEILRKESLIRLLQEDRRVPLELKEAYSAFVRQGIQKNWRYIPRSFASSDDVPDLKRLQDRSIQVRVRKKKHKTDLMFRASQTNKDRTGILTHNNPLPNINEEGLESSVGRYLPSWIDTGSEISELEYTKWIRESHDARQEDDLTGREKENVQIDEDYDTLDQDLIMLLTRKRKPEPKPKYVFLTEKEARCKGQFAAKFKEERDNKDIPKAFAEAKVPDFKSHSVLGMDSGDSFSAKSEDRPSCQSAPLPDKQYRMYREYVSDWEPLSMNALVEYKEKIQTEGEGEFNSGRPKMWATELKVI